MSSPAEKKPEPTSAAIAEPARSLDDASNDRGQDSSIATTGKGRGRNPPPTELAPSTPAAKPRTKGDQIALSVPPAAPAVAAPTPPNAEGQIPSAAKAHAAEVRRARSRKLMKRLALFVLTPTLAATAYFGFVATPQFESYSTFTVQSSDTRPTLGMEGLLAGIATGAGQDALAVRDYALSRDMLALLEKEDAFIAHYRSPNHDWLSRLSADTTFEDAYEYFGSKIYADYDQTSGAVTLRVRAFAPDRAEKFAKTILAGSEAMVNGLSERQRRDRTRYAEAQLKVAEERLQSSRKAMVALQQKHGDFNPLQTAGAAMEIRTQLEAELAKARAELMQLKSFMNETAPQVRAANEKIASLAAQAAVESRRLVHPKASSGLNASLVDFEAALTEKEFAEKSYASALTALELARADADRQHRYLAIVAGPSKPDASTYPHRVRSVIAVFFLSFLLLGIVSLLGAAVREHARL